jgi:hypothetical protein
VEQPRDAVFRRAADGGCGVVRRPSLQVPRFVSGPIAWASAPLIERAQGGRSHGASRSQSGPHVFAKELAIAQHRRRSRSRFRLLLGVTNAVDRKPSSDEGSKYRRRTRRFHVVTPYPGAATAVPRTWRTGRSSRISAPAQSVAGRTRARSLPVQESRQ